MSAMPDTSELALSSDIDPRSTIGDQAMTGAVDGSPTAERKGKVKKDSEGGDEAGEVEDEDDKYEAMGIDLKLLDSDEPRKLREIDEACDAETEEIGAELKELLRALRAAELGQKDKLGGENQGKISAKVRAELKKVNDAAVGMLVKDAVTFILRQREDEAAAKFLDTGTYQRLEFVRWSDYEVPITAIMRKKNFVVIGQLSADDVGPFSTPYVQWKPWIKLQINANGDWIPKSYVSKGRQQIQHGGIWAWTSARPATTLPGRSAHDKNINKAYDSLIPKVFEILCKKIWKDDDYPDSEASFAYSKTATGQKWEGQRSGLHGGRY
ncbi:MAG: hypothetical protein M1820_006179 [Bogoriella megaspora]|nr:MAG: hypothetical protein M1820_006179 [Bogoriella megaspora]